MMCHRVINETNNIILDNCKCKTLWGELEYVGACGHINNGRNSRMCSEVCKTVYVPCHELSMNLSMKDA